MSTTNNAQSNWILKCFNDTLRIGSAMYRGMNKDDTFIEEFTQWQTTTLLLLERVTPQGSVLNRFIQVLAEETWRTISCDSLQAHIGHLRAMKECYIGGFLLYKIPQDK